MKITKSILSIRNKFMPIAANSSQLETSGHTSIRKNKPSAAIDLIHQLSDLRIRLGCDLNVKGNLNGLGHLQIISRFTSFGFINNSL